jgi:hypothetical protein
MEKMLVFDQYPERGRTLLGIMRGATCRRDYGARRTIQGYEAVHMIRKGQIRWVAGDDLPRQIKFIDHLFNLAA